MHNGFEEGFVAGFSAAWNQIKIPQNVYGSWNQPPRPGPARVMPDRLK